MTEKTKDELIALLRRAPQYEPTLTEPLKCMLAMQIHHTTITRLLGVAREDLSNEESEMLQRALELFDKAFHDLQALLNAPK